MAEVRPSSDELNAYGSLYAASLFWGTTLATALQAIQIFMVFYGLSAFSGLSKNERSGRLRYIAISLAILVASSIDTMLDIWQCYRILYTGGPTGFSYVQSGNKYFEARRNTIVVGDTMLCIVVGLGDALMLWRCFIMWDHKRWAIVIPSLTCIGTVVSMVISIILILTNTGPAYKAQVASVALSVATNIMTTFLILYRLLIAWFGRRTAFPDQKSPRMYRDVTSVILESAAPLAFLGICLIVTTTIVQLYPPSDFSERSRFSTANDLMGWLYYGFCALSPQIIIFRVTVGKSWRDAADSQSGAASLSRPIQFAQSVQARSRSSNLTEDA